MTSRSDRRAWRVVALAAALALVASACSHGGSDTNRGTRPSTDPGQESNGGPTTSTTRPDGTGGTGNGGGGNSSGGRSGRTGGSPVHDGIRIEVLSSQPDRVSGDDARVRVTPARGRDASGLRVRLGDRDITQQLQAEGGHLEGVITGLVEGNNTLTATGAGPKALQRLRAWPLSGPIISGPQQPVGACSTEELGLGPPTGDSCSAPTKVTWRYIDTNQQVRELPDPEKRPTDVATATIEGRSVPLFVRYEQGVIDRAVYAIATVDPTPGDPSPLASEPGWNQKLLYRYAGGCGVTFGQGRSLPRVLEPAYLAQGYAVASSTLNDFGTQCNDVLSAEATMMVKERAIEEFGVPRFTIGEGASSGAMALHLIAQDYPGLVDGVVATQPFPDTVSVASGATDCGLLLHYESTPAGRALTDVQRQAIAGHASAATCASWRGAIGATIDPVRGCDLRISAERIYDPTSRRGGLRCTYQDANRNQLGMDPKTGFAKRPLDNVGVQYGLEALDAKVISVDQFLDLNAHVGGYDLDGHITTEREVADPETVLRTYEAGRVANGGGDLLEIPIIELTAFANGSSDIHDRFRAFSLRDRLAPGDESERAPGLQIWTRDGADPNVALAAAAAANGQGAFGLDAVVAVDQWLTAISADREGGDRHQLLRRTRPAVAIDNCLPAGTKAPVSGIGIYDLAGPCRDRFPLAGDPRTAAGAPRRDDIIKCERKPLDPTDYDVDLSSAQLARLQTVFPQGVCDYARLGAGQTVPAQPDRTYDDVITPEQNA
ncbi:MAG: DUF6351 family protein [Acidimicrobiales bacterium]